jgi:hypothetical protein
MKEEHGMKEEHTFPLPEMEAHKLDDLKMQLQNGSPARRLVRAAQTWVTAHPISVLAATTAAGCLLTIGWRKYQSS